jgi:spore coat protein U-like protein
MHLYAACRHGFVILKFFFGTLFAAGICSVLLSCAYAQTTITDNLTVTVEIQAECTIVTTSTLDFGTQGVLDADVDNTGSVTVQCTSGADYDVGLDAGSGSGATTSDRKMTGPASATIDYSLFSNSGRTTNWGDTVSTDTVSGTGDGSTQVLTIYGRIPTQTTPTAGTYTDTVEVSVTY